MAVIYETAVIKHSRYFAKSWRSRFTGQTINPLIWNTNKGSECARDARDSGCFRAVDKFDKLPLRESRRSKSFEARGNGNKSAAATSALRHVIAGANPRVVIGERPGALNTTADSSRVEINRAFWPTSRSYEFAEETDANVYKVFRRVREREFSIVTDDKFELSRFRDILSLSSFLGETRESSR